jgi:hypothetical protein
MEHKLVDGVKVVLTDAEIAQRAAEEQSWLAGAFDRSLASLRAKRNSLLSASDWTVLSDSPVQDKLIWQSYRQSLRDLTEGLSTVEQINSVVFPTKP